MSEISPIFFVMRSKRNNWANAPKRPPPVTTIAISFGEKPNLWSTNKLKRDSKADSPKLEMKISKKAMK